MSDPIETHLIALRQATHFQVPDPALVRRRGDRLRHRNSALKAGGAALALTLIATPLLSLTRHGGHEAPPSTHRLQPGPALRLKDLPDRADLGDWAAVEPTGKGSALACVPPKVTQGLRAQTSLERRFVARDAASENTGPYTAQIGETVLQFAGRPGAVDAMQSVASWLQDCAAPDLVSKPGSITSETVKGFGFWETVLRSAHDFCGNTDCDAAWFDGEAVLRVGDRLVLVSMAEVGGPAQPKGFKTSMRQLTTTAAKLATG